MSMSTQAVVTLRHHEGAIMRHDKYGAPVRAQCLVTRRNAEDAPFANAAETAPEGR
jgi:hypothetical protein